MSFREKSAWVMALLMIAVGLCYWRTVSAASQAIGSTAPAAVVFSFVVLVVVGSIVVQTVLALSAPREANAGADERERRVEAKAGHWAGVLLAVGAVLSLGHFLMRADGNMLFHLVMASLIVAQIAEYAFQIILVRRSF